MINTILKIGGKTIKWVKLFTCASGNGYVPNGNFWKVWREFPGDCKAAGFEPEKQRDGSWLILSHKIQP